MLTELKVKNYALIKDLVFKPSQSFNVITGETGAGKSILLGAIGLIIGERADSVSVKQNEEKCLVEAIFQIQDYSLQSWFDANDIDYSDELIIRREISITGKSRAFINDTPAQLNQLKELGKFLIDIHSQHDNLELFQKSFQFQVLDSFSGINTEVKHYSKQYESLKILKLKYITLIDAEKRINNDKDYKQFLFDELTSAHLKEGEMEALEEELLILSHAESTIQLLSAIHNQMAETDQSLIDQMAIIKSQLTQVAKNDRRFEEIATQFGNLSYELKEIDAELSKLALSTQINPERLEMVNQRMALLHQLNSKHKGENLLLVLKSLDEELQSYSNLEDEIKALSMEIERLEAFSLAMAREISSKRCQNAVLLQLEINKSIIDLGMPGAKIKVEVNQAQSPVLNIYGIDDTNFLYSPAQGKTFNPIQNIASGGEISRVMLVLKSILAHKNVMPTLIFDEIDTGVSGEVAFKMGEMLHAISKNMQLITITHLPQIAAKGKSHFYVYKKLLEGQTSSDIKQLSEAERVAEIAEMIGGKTYSPSILESAKQLLNS
jgi:DNA repair protein RecN (Recombination protein N)